MRFEVSGNSGYFKPEGFRQAITKDATFRKLRIVQTAGSTKKALSLSYTPIPPTPFLTSSRTCRGFLPVFSALRRRTCEDRGRNGDRSQPSAQNEVRSERPHTREDAATIL